MTDKAIKEDKKPNPPYLPFKTFTRLIGVFEHVVPQVIDSSVLGKFSGSDRAALIPALKFLGLLDADQRVKPELDALIKAYGKPEWKSKLRERITASYADIINGLDVSTATRRQLEERFKDIPSTVLQKTIRFYISAAQEAGIPLSKFITERQKRARGERKPPNKGKGSSSITKTGQGSSGDSPPDMLKGYKEWTSPIKDKQPVKIYVPENITKNEWENVRKMLSLTIEMIETYFGFSQGNK